jgi:hypothetical protein
MLVSMPHQLQYLPQVEQTQGRQQQWALTTESIAAVHTPQFNPSSRSRAVDASICCCEQLLLNLLLGFSAVQCGDQHCSWLFQLTKLKRRGALPEIVAKVWEYAGRVPGSDALNSNEVINQ